ncbi:UNVERIFIED_CONTAM: hypothetical protein FKN15_033683 [Acipenser sinensis]
MRGPASSRHVSSRLVSSRLVSSRLVSSRHVTSRLVSSRLVSSRLVSSRLVSSRLVSSRHVTSRHVTSRLVSSRLVSSRHVTSQALLMWCAAYQQLFSAQETKPATTGLQSKKPGLTPRLVVRGSAPVISSADPFEWAEMKHGTTKKAAEELFLEMTSYIVSDYHGCFAQGIRCSRKASVASPQSTPEGKGLKKSMGPEDWETCLAEVNHGGARLSFNTQNEVAAFLSQHFQDFEVPVVSTARKALRFPSEEKID